MLIRWSQIVTKCCRDVPAMPYGCQQSGSLGPQAKPRWRSPGLQTSSRRLIPHRRCPANCVKLGMVLGCSELFVSFCIYLLGLNFTNWPDLFDSTYQMLVLNPSNYLEASSRSPIAIWWEKPMLARWTELNSFLKHTVETARGTRNAIELHRWLHSTKNSVHLEASDNADVLQHFFLLLVLVMSCCNSCNKDGGWITVLVRKWQQWVTLPHAENRHECCEVPSFEKSKATSSVTYILLPCFHQCFFTLAASSLDLPSSIRLHLFHCHCLIVGSQQQATVQQPSSLSSSWRSVPSHWLPLIQQLPASGMLPEAWPMAPQRHFEMQSLKMPWLAHQYLGIWGDLHVLMCIYRYMTTYELHMIYIYIHN